MGAAPAEVIDLLQHSGAVVPARQGIQPPVAVEARGLAPFGVLGVEDNGSSIAILGRCKDV